MNITVQVDEVSLSSAVADIVGYDEGTGEPYKAGEGTIADLVADRIVAQLRRDTKSWHGLTQRYRDVRDELIRELCRPLIVEAIERPITRTNTYGEPTGQITTLAELITDEARKALNKPADPHGYGRSQTLVQKVVAEQVKTALTDEIADAVKQARAAVREHIGAAVAAAVTKSIR